MLANDEDEGQTVPCTTHATQIEMVPMQSLLQTPKLCQSTSLHASTAKPMARCSRAYRVLLKLGVVVVVLHVPPAAAAAAPVPVGHDGEHTTSTKEAPNRNKSRQKEGHVMFTTWITPITGTERGRDATAPSASCVGITHSEVCLKLEELREQQL